jgi:hypothetical protein
MKSAAKLFLCIKECDNSAFRAELGQGIKLYNFMPGEKYLYHNCEKKKYNFIYRKGSDYHGCVPHEFIRKYFIPVMEYENIESIAKEVDSLFDKNFYGREN